jgi:hypothetical protein
MKNFILVTAFIFSIVFANGQETSTGNIGIGTLTPGNKLEINQGTAGKSGLRFTSLTRGTVAAPSSGKVLSVDANGDVVLEEAAPVAAGITGLTTNRFLLAASATTIADDSLLTMAHNGAENFLLIKPASDALRDVLKIQSPSLHAGSLPFTFRYHFSPNADGTANTPMQFGFNTDGIEDPLQPGIGFSIEPRFMTGGLHLMELHQNVYLPPSAGHPGGESARILTPTFTVGDSLGNSYNHWDMRGNTFQISTLTSKNYFSVGTNVNGGTSMNLRDPKSGYGIEYEFTGADSIIYIDGIGAAHLDFAYRKTKRFYFDLENAKAPWISLNDPGSTPAFYNFTAFDTVGITGYSPAVALKGNIVFAALAANTATKEIQDYVAPGFYKSIFAGGSEAVRITANRTVGIGTAAPDKSAKVEISSTTQGFLPPRMTAAEANTISSPAEGLMVYVKDTDSNTPFTAKGWWGYNGSAWVRLNN